jgi:cysteine synthase
MICQSGGFIQAFCDYVGTGGSLAGCAAAFKEHNPGILRFVVEPVGAAVLAGHPVTDPNHRIQGGRYAGPRKLDTKVGRNKVQYEPSEYDTPLADKPKPCW